MAGRGIRQPKRPHKKSRLGCSTCKRRRVKCDESRPACTGCLAFGLPCDYSNLAGVPTPADASRASSSQVSTHSSLPINIGLPQRGRGRPRKDWAASLGLILQPSAVPLGPPGRISDALRLEGQGASVDDHLNLGQAELLHHFSMCTGPSLVGSDMPNHPVVLFWQNNAPRLGLSHPYVLHLTLSLAAFHLYHLYGAEQLAKNRYLSLARRHLSTGIADMTKALASMDNGNCGALLVSSMLICSCAFAAGPIGPDDLLITELGDSSSGRLVQLSRGARLIQDSFDATTLFTGLLSPLAPAVSGSLDDLRPSCVCLGFPRVDWIAPLDRLRKIVILDGSPYAPVYLRAFNTIATMYEAVYGNELGILKCPTYYKMVLMFIYMAEDVFVASLKREDTIAMLILAYYAPLLESDPRDWHLHGWARHILRSIQSRIKNEYSRFLDWPIEITS